MRVLIAGLLVAAAAISVLPANAVTHKVSCLCDCPDDLKAKPQHAAAMPAPARRPVRRVARRSYGYNYASAAPIGGGEWHGEWRVAPGDMIQAYNSPPQSYPAPDYAPEGYGPPPGYYQQSAMRVDDKGWTGGVGANADGGGGGGGGGFMDGFGQVHFAQGGGQENGPTYNSYNQSFQYNPSVAGQFQNRLMGGLAPAK